MLRLFLVAALISGALFTSAQSTAPAASSTQEIYNARAKSAQQKFDHIRQNGTERKPDQKPTVMSESEVNAWLLSGNAQLPTGVKKLQFTAPEPNMVRAVATVDFDAITAKRRSSNPLLRLFTGTHQVQAGAHASGSGGKGNVHIESVSIDGVPVPKLALEYFVDKYIKPKYPNLGIDSVFDLPHRIDTAIVGAHELRVIQK